MKKLFYSLMVFIVFLSLHSISAMGLEIKNPNTFIRSTPSTVETLDLHLMTSRATTEISLNVYDSLFSKNDKGELIPSLATKVPSLDNGLIQVDETGATTIEIPIREGVLFHNGAILTPEDVEYTYKRAAVIGAHSTITRSLLQSDSFKALVEEIGLESALDRLNQSITVKDHSVFFHFPAAYAPFLGRLGDNGGHHGILNKEWSIENGAWDGTKESAKKNMDITMGTNPLHDKMMGTGPFKLAAWIKDERIELVRHDEYWQGPAHLERVIRQIVPEISTVLLMLQNGDIDLTTHINPQHVEQLKAMNGIQTIGSIPQNWLFKINFNFLVHGDRYIGSGKLDSHGIPPDFFSDINIRKAFQYTFDFQTFIDDVLLGEGIKPYGPVLVDFPTANTNTPQYYFDLEKAEKYFREAWDGLVWEKGFKMNVPYSAGSMPRQMALEILQANLKKINPKFILEISSLPWAAYVGAINDKELPMSIFGILPSIDHPHYPLEYHMHSGGFYANLNSYTDLAKERYDHLIDEIGTSFDNKRVEELSHKLQLLNYEDSLSIFHYQVVSQVAFRDWVKGYDPGTFVGTVNYYPIYKSN